MSTPYRHSHYGASGPDHRQRVRGNPEQDAYADHAFQQDYAYEPYSREYHDQYAYERDYYGAYPAAYREYDQRGYPEAHGYDWRDAYPHHQTQGYAAQSNNGSYDAQSYYRAQPAYPSAHRHPYEAHATQPYASSHPPHRVWNNPQVAPEPVQGAPAAPKKMRDAASAAAPAYETLAQAADSQGLYRPPHSYYPNRLQHQQPQQYRDYHSQASDSSRFLPYDRSSPSAPGTPSHPSSYRPSPMTRRPPAIRAAPRPSYLEQAKQPSSQLSDDQARDRKLLVVLDLNGTLVFRAKSGNGRAIDSVRAVPRPFLRCFLQYCLGLQPGDAATPSTVSKGKEVQAEKRPHGSHFWQAHDDAENASVCEPCSAGKAEVIVWSSAQPGNVDSMIRASFDDSVRSQVLRVWARDTLVPQRFYQGKAESIKDLEIVWAELNAFTHDKPSLERLMAQARDLADQARPDDVPPPTAPTAPAAHKKYKGKKNKEKNKLKAQQTKLQQEQVSAALEAAKMAEELGPWGPHNTVLVDDSVAKARLQPFNHLLISEYGKEDAGRMRKFIRQEMALQGVAAETDVDLEYDSDLSVADETRAPSNTVDETRGDEDMDEVEEAAKKSKKKPIPESRLDDVLLQTIGVLETLRYQSNVSAFVYSGGIQGYGQPKTALNEEQRLEKVQQGQTPEFWSEKGREVCGKLGIEVKAWLPGTAASATAALL